MSTPAQHQLEKDIGHAMRADRYRFRSQLRDLAKSINEGQLPGDRLARLAEAVRRSVALRESRHRGVPRIHYDDELPVSAKRGEIALTIRDNQVVIVSGETGSGKSTQLPKICLEMGRGIDGLIGHTQPRRIAARSVAARIADELGTPLGRDVGFKVRFAESLSPQTYIKLMTDGILLAETQGDSFLDQYDTIILDEAHERSLNIDFLIGYLKRLLPKRRDLKLIITSATIDAARFSAHFATPDGPAPVVEVSGRTYPVEVRWRPPMPDEDGGEPDLQQAVLAAVEEVASIDRGDVLIFMPTERHIHETSKTLRDRPLPGDPTGRETEILPLYARLSIREQQRVFQPGPKRRIVIATNVAESSLTVPRIRYVIDPGTARISRYSPRSKTQRLPIEAVSRASADQRKGRCGRIGPGVCLRLFSEEDYLTRDAYTVPEIQRTNLASVILQTKALRLGQIELFPFLDPPKPDAVRDGYRTLVELGALDAKGELTEIGRQLSRLPVDPRIGRMILAAADECCLPEVLVIAAALSVQDPRERPLEKQESADACHALRADEQSDFVSYLNLWEFYHKLKSDLSRNQLQKACRQNFLSSNRMREWLDVHRELMELARQAQLLSSGTDRRLVGRGAKGEGFSTDVPAAHRIKGGRTDRQHFDNMHRAILTGLLSNVALRGESYEYSVGGGGKANIWPGSGLFKQKPKWLVAAELVETTRRYMRTCARIDPNWIEPIAGHLVKRLYHGVHWDPAQASAMALERVTLFGLTIIAGRRIHYGPIDPDMSRHLMIEQGLVEGQIDSKPAFLVQNEKLVEELDRLQAKLRRLDLLVGDSARYEFYDRRIPANVCDGATLTNWLRTNPRALTMTKSDLVHEEIGNLSEEQFPDAMNVHHLNLPLEYKYDPGSQQDGVTLNVPIEALNQVAPEPLSWLVPGLIEEKVLALIRSLPKSLRTQFVPAPETAKRVVPMLRFGDGDIHVAVAAALGRLAGVTIPPNAFQQDRLPAELKMNVRVTDAEGRQLAVGRDLEAIRHELGLQAADIFSRFDDPHWNRDGLTGWDFDALPPEIELSRGHLTVKAYPTLIDRDDSVSLRLVDSARRAECEMHFGLRRLCYLATRRKLENQVAWLPNLDKIEVYAATLPGFDLRRQLAELLADRAMVAGQPVPRTKADFQYLLDTGRQRIAWAMQELTAVVAPIFEELHRASIALEDLCSKPTGKQLPALHLGAKTNFRSAPAQPGSAPKKNTRSKVGLFGALINKMPAANLPPYNVSNNTKGAAAKTADVDSNAPRWQYALDDIREQIARLMDPKTFSKTPWDWLRQYPRYFRAVCCRLENLQCALPRDLQNHEEFQTRWRRYQEHALQRQTQGVIDPELIHMRWMLEEYRVSLFAQKLGTSIPVSPKRLDQQWTKLQG
jgi:ATP-dependent RNA helicase HrpA